MTTRMQQRRDTAANWTSNNPTLAAGEIGLETDTNNFKIGNGSTAWTSLGYSSNQNLAINAQTGTTYTTVLSDANYSLVELSNSSAIAVTIPLNSSVAYPVGAVINMVQTGAGQVTISGASGVTITSTGATSTTPKLRTQYSSCSVIQNSTNNWLVIGDIA